MAERRMFAKTIIDSDAFLEMPLTSQLLYFHLSMRGDDDGFINKPKTIMRMIGCKDDDINLLIIKKFIIPFDSGVVVIKHWKIHNYIQSDRYNETKYKIEKEQLVLDENKSYSKKNEVNVIDNNHDIYLDVDNKDKVKRFIPPTIEELSLFIKENKLNVDANEFVYYYESKGWLIGGKAKMKDWKSAAKRWSINNYNNNQKRRIEIVSDYSNDNNVEMSDDEIEKLKYALKNI